MVIYCHVYGVSVINNNGFCNWLLGLLALLYNYCQLCQLTHWTPSERRLSDGSPWRTLSNLGLTQSQSQSYVTTDGQPASLSWNKAPVRGLRPDLNYCLTVAGLLIWAPSLTRGQVCRLQLLLASPAQLFSEPSPVGLVAIFCTVSDSRLPFSSPPTTRRVTMEVFDPASTRVSDSMHEWTPYYNC
jgi:hypothetical protein